MTASEFSIIVGALAGLIVAVTGLIAAVRQTHALVNSRMSELLALTRTSAKAEGVLQATEAAPTEPVKLPQR